MSAPPSIPPFALGSWAAANRKAALACARKAFGKVPRHQLEWIDGKRDAVAFKRWRRGQLASIRALMARMTAAGVSFLVTGVGPRGGFDQARCQLPRFDLPGQVVKAPAVVTQPAKRPQPAWGYLKSTSPSNAAQNEQASVARLHGHTTSGSSDNAKSQAATSAGNPAALAHSRNASTVVSMPPKSTTQPAWGYLKRQAA